MCRFFKRFKKWEPTCDNELVRLDLSNPDYKINYEDVVNYTGYLISMGFTNLTIIRNDDTNVYSIHSMYDNIANRYRNIMINSYGDYFYRKKYELIVSLRDEKIKYYKRYYNAIHDNGFVECIPIPYFNKGEDVPIIKNENTNSVYRKDNLPEDISKIFIFYHDDHDGIFAARIAYEYLKNKYSSSRHKKPIYTGMMFTIYDNEGDTSDIDIKLIPILDYSQNLSHSFIKELNNKKLSGNELFVFLDYSFTNKDNINFIKDLRDHNYDILWIDHHASSLKIVDLQDINGIRDTSGCGALLTYKYFYDNDIPRIIEYVDSYDRWTNELPYTQEFHYGLLVDSPLNEFFDSDWMNNTSLIDDAISDGKEFLKIYDYENKTMHMNYSFPFEIEFKGITYTCLGINRRGPSRMFLDEIKNYDMVCPMYFNGDKFIYSLYVDKSKNTPAGEIAEALGGGGHPKAAGFQKDTIIFKKNSTFKID